MQITTRKTEPFWFYYPPPEGMSLHSPSWCELKKPKIGIGDSNQSSELSFCVIELKPSPIDRAPGAAHSQSRKNITTILQKKIFNKTSPFLLSVQGHKGVKHVPAVQVTRARDLGAS